jgi:hypothetical protein
MFSFWPDPQGTRVVRRFVDQDEAARRGLRAYGPRITGEEPQGPEVTVGLAPVSRRRRSEGSEPVEGRLRLNLLFAQCGRYSRRQAWS